MFIILPRSTTILENHVTKSIATYSLGFTNQLTLVAVVFIVILHTNANIKTLLCFPHAWIYAYPCFTLCVNPNPVDLHTMSSALGTPTWPFPKWLFLSVPTGSCLYLYYSIIAFLLLIMCIFLPLVIVVSHQKNLMPYLFITTFSLSPDQVWHNSWHNVSNL